MPTLPFSRDSQEPGSSEAGDRDSFKKRGIGQRGECSGHKPYEDFNRANVSISDRHKTANTGRGEEADGKGHGEHSDCKPGRDTEKKEMRCFLGEHTCSSACAAYLENANPHCYLLFWMRETSKNLEAIKEILKGAG